MSIRRGKTNKQRYEAITDVGGGLRNIVTSFLQKTCPSNMFVGANVYVNINERQSTLSFNILRDPTSGSESSEMYTDEQDCNELALDLATCTYDATQHFFSIKSYISTILTDRAKL